MEVQKHLNGTHLLRGAHQPQKLAFLTLKCGQPNSFSLVLIFHKFSLTS
jgi:hypothetical protein